MDNILSLIRFSPDAVARRIAARATAARLRLGWSRKLLAQRSGVTEASIKRFERTGKIALERLLRIALILDAKEGWEGLFAEHSPPAASIKDLERQHPPSRKRGRTQQK